MQISVFHCTTTYSTYIDTCPLLLAPWVWPRFGVSLSEVVVVGTRTHQWWSYGGGWAAQECTASVWDGQREAQILSALPTKAQQPNIEIIKYKSIKIYIIKVMFLSKCMPFRWSHCNMGKVQCKCISPPCTKRESGGSHHNLSLRTTTTTDWPSSPERGRHAMQYDDDALSSRGLWTWRWTFRK